MFGLSLFISSVYGALVGTVGYNFVKTLNKKRNTANNYPITAFFIITALFIAGLTGSVETFLLKYQVESLISNMPLNIYPTIKEYDPDTYNRFIEELITVYKNDKSKTQTLHWVKRESVMMFHNYLSGAADNAIIDYFNSMVESIKYVMEENPLICAQTLLPKAYAAWDSDAFFIKLDKEHIQHILESFKTLVVTASSNKTPLPENAKGRVLLNQIIEKFGKEYPDKLKNIKYPAFKLGHATIVKQINSILDFYHYIKIKSGADYALVLKTLLKGLDRFGFKNPLEVL